MTNHGAVSAEVSIGRVLRQVRERQGLSLRTAAGRAGFSASFLSQVETGQASPSIGSLARIAAVLAVTLSDLFQATEPRETVVVRAVERPSFTSQWSQARVESLVGPATRRPFEALSITLESGGSSGRTTQAHGTDQFAYLVRGTLRLDLGEQQLVLGEGDSAVIPRGQPHRWENAGTGASEVLLVAIRAGSG